MTDGVVPVRAQTSLHRFLTRLIWLCVGPLVVLAVYLAVERVRDVQANRDREASGLASTLATAVDQDLNARIAALKMLTESPLLDDASRLREVYREAQGFRQSFGSHVILADLNMQMLFNTRVPFGTALPHLPRPQGRAAAPIAAATGRPAVGDLFPGPVAKEPLVALAVPVLRDGKTAMLLLTVFEGQQFQKHLDQLMLPADWAVVLLDGQGEAIARRAAPGFQASVGVDASGRFTVKSTSSPWSVVLEIPRDAYRSPQLQAAAALALAVLGATLTGVVGGTLASRRLGSMVASLAQPPTPGAPPPVIAEIARARTLLDEAAQRRETAEATLLVSEQRFRRLFYEAPLPQALIATDGVLIDLNARFVEVFGYRLEDVPTLTDWWLHAYADPAARASAAEAWQAAAARVDAAAGIKPVEHGIVCKSGAVRIMVVSGIRIGDDFLFTFFDVTERKEAAEAVRQSAALYQHTLDHMLEGCQIIGFDWCYRYLNAAGARQNRQPMDRLLGRTMMEIYPDIEATEIFAVLSHCMTERVARHIETEFRFPDGAQGWFDVNVQPVPDGIVIFSVDITERKRVEEARQGLAAIVESSDDAIISKTLQGVITSWNPGAERLFGYRADEAIGQPLLMLIPPERSDEESDILTRIACGERIEHFETVRVRQDGQRVHVSATVSPIRDAQGRVVGASKIARDITDRKLAQFHLQAQLERLNLLDQITCAIGERQDLPSIYQVVIRSLEERLPVDFSCICRHDAVDDRLTVVRVGAHSHALATALAMEEHARIEVEQNGQSRCLRGELVHEPDIAASASAFLQRLARVGLNSLVMAPLRAESRVFGILMVARRQSRTFSSGECEFLRQLSSHVALAAQQAQLYQALQQAYDELRQTQQAVLQQERLRALGQMASGIAHDINNAISPILLYTESLLERELQLSERGRGYLQTIARSIDDVAATVARLGEFYRQREPQLTLVPVQLNTLVAQVVELTRSRWSDMPQQRGVVIHVGTELAPDLPTVRGVESEIREALVNLVFNAVDAMPDGGTLTLRTQHNPSTVQVDVIDTGVGMNEDTRRRCLEPFFTTKGERGTGLGLAMVYGVAQRHGADVDIDSVVGHGSTVRLSFPVPVHETAPSALTPRSEGPAAPLRILLVDDDPIVLKSLRDTLEADGHAVVAMDDGQLAIDTFRAACATADAFDIVVTDLGMPHVDGRQVAAAVKQAARSTPVILLTGWGQRLIADDDIPAHVDRVLGKPPKLRELRAALAQLTAATPPDARTDAAGGAAT